MVEGGMKCVKYLVFAFNLLFLLFGALLIGLGVYVQTALKDYLNFYDGDANGPAIVIIVFGAITFVVAFFGCCGAIKENACMTTTFAALIAIILICELGGGIAAFVLKGKVDEALRKGMSEAMDNYDTSAGVKTSWDAAQKNLHCCGTSNATDWQTKIPDSCLCKEQKDCEDGAVGQPFTVGCFDKVEEILMSKIAIVAGAGVGLAVVEILGIILACCLARSIRNEYEIA